jgi:cell shape-determining protein MreC
VLSSLTCNRTLTTVSQAALFTIIVIHTFIVKSLFSAKTTDVTSVPEVVEDVLLVILSVVHTLKAVCAGVTNLSVTTQAVASASLAL